MSSQHGKTISNIAIIGGGPAGSSLGALLAKRGCKVAIFHTDKRPPLIVGESLLPAVVPMLRTLGVEDEIRSFSIHKPGATVCLKVDEVISAFFRWADCGLPDYSYNTPRDLFDRAILNAAEKAGAKIFKTAAHIEKGATPNTVRLSEETLAATDGYFAAAPDLIVDASGRNRAIARLLETPEQRGGRNDVAIFAHLDKTLMTDPANIHIDYLTRGWSWRIPLPGRISVGVVINPKHLEKFGSGIEAQYDAYIHEEPSLKYYTEGAKRLTPVVRYQNYQLVSQRMYGPGWALIGDAAGFVDPVFSTGVYLGMKSAFELDKAMDIGTDRAWQQYQSERIWEFSRWQTVIDSWYNGKLFNLYRAGEKHKQNAVGRKISQRVQRRLLKIFSGNAVDDSINLKIFGYLTELGKVLRNPADLVIA